MPDIGYSFAPGSDASAPSGAPGARRPSIGAQEALQILSLVLPRQAAPHGIAPQSLLTSPGAAGGSDPGLALLSKILSSLGVGGQSAPGGGAAMSPAGSASTMSSPFSTPSLPSAPASASQPPNVTAGIRAPDGTAAPAPPAPASTPAGPSWAVPQLPRTIFNGGASSGGGGGRNPF